GAGIIGVCTAYYLTRHPKYSPDKYKITVIEATRPAGGASGKAGGLLATWAFPQQIVPLSFKLHEELAAEYNGEEEWGYRHVNTVSITGDFRSDSKSCSDIPADLDWIRPELVESVSPIGGENSTAQVHPLKFTLFMLRRAQEAGVELIIGQVHDFIYDRAGSIRGVRYSSRDAQDTSIGKTIDFAADEVVITAGPWVSRLIPTCPISGLRAHSITITPTRPVSAYALFTEIKDRSKIVCPEIYARKDEVYVCGEGDNFVGLPDTTDNVSVSKEKCDELYKYASALSEEMGGGRLNKRQACYLPVVDLPSSSGPLIGQTNVKHLWMAAGHSCWGINNAPGTGKLMSELLIDGKATSASLRGLDPKKHFAVMPKNQSSR
ncbi:hypothetical protein CANCADRAFT_27609, partial [Tortispora caseinolytica NRRL Y-17796]